MEEGLKDYRGMVEMGNWELGMDVGSAALCAWK